MAGIVWQKGQRAFVDGLLGGQSNYLTPVLVPTAGGNWGLGLGTRVGGVGSNAGDAMAQIIEVGTSVQAGYGRQVITRDQTTSGWPAATLATYYQSTAPQVTFSFTNPPTPNGATLWFLAGSTVLGADNALFGADLAATRTFGNGDSLRVTSTFAQS